MFFSGFTLTRFIRQTLPFIHSYCSSLSLSAVNKPVKGKYVRVVMHE